MTPQTKAKILNGILFQLVWFSCVLGGANQLIWPGAVTAALLLVSILVQRIWHLDLRVSAVCFVSGLILDTVWIRTGVLDYSGAQFPPVWIGLMWIGVGLTVNHSLAMFRDRPLLGALAVAVAAPLSYLAGARLGAVNVPADIPLLWISLAWGVLFYLVFVYSSRAHTLALAHSS